MSEERTTRSEHLEWCKSRALEYLGAGDRHGAMMSMLSDLGKHPDTTGLQGMGVMIMLTAHTDEDARRFIEGFN